MFFFPEKMRFYWIRMRGKILTEIGLYEENCAAVSQKLEEDSSGKTGNIFLLRSQYFMKKPLDVCNQPKALLATVQWELSTARRYHHVRDANARISVVAKSVVVLERNSKPLRQRNWFELSLKLCHKKTVLPFLINNLWRHQLTAASFGSIP